jgi:hypothetical protein
MDEYLKACNPWGGNMRTVHWDGPGPDPTTLPMATEGLTVDKAVDPVVRTLPAESTARKATPVVTGVLDYFPAAIAAVARVSKAGNDKHNPGQRLHHSRGKSTDHADAIGRHLMERGGVDPDTGERHSAELAWRALANLQQELEDAGEAPLARGASYDIGAEEAAGIVLPDRSEADLASAWSYEEGLRDVYNDAIIDASDMLQRQGFHGLAEDVEKLRR